MEELRYPFESALEFFSGGYFLQREAFHLDFAYCWMLGTGIATFAALRNLRLTACVLFFSLSTYNNFAFTLGGVGPNEVAGFLCLILTVLRRKSVTSQPTSTFFRAAYDVLFVTFIYTVVIILSWPQLLEVETTLFQRLVVFGKPILLFGVGSVFVANFDAIEHKVYWCVGIAVLGACFVYMIQVGLLLVVKTMPYGTYLSAGNFWLLSFGGTSIERGHFAKFFVPFFPVLLARALNKEGRLLLTFFCVICLINFSASGYAFFTFMVLCFLWLCRGAAELSRSYSRNYKILLFLIFAMACAVFSQFGTALLSLVNKIYSFAVLGDESEGGGRSSRLFFEYLTTYPLGIGYGGSTFRTAPGLAEINSGIFAFITQFGPLSGPVLALWFFSWVCVIAQFRFRVSKSPQSLALMVGMLAMPLIFFADVLWFVPSAWMCFFVALAMIRRSSVPAYKSLPTTATS